MEILNGIDLSYANTVTSYTILKTQIDFAIIRAGYGRNNVDTQRVKHLSNLKDKPLGFYWFSYAYTPTMAMQEANYMCDFMDAYKIPNYFPLYFDFEYDSVEYFKKITSKEPSRQDILNITDAFILECSKRGYIASIYTNKDFMRRYYDKYNYKIWLADYTTTEFKPDILQQTTSTGSIRGVQGAVDLDRCADTFIIDIFAGKEGWVQVYDKWAYVHEGTRYFDKWVTPYADGYWYYIDSYGWMVTDTLKEINGELYHFNKDGHMSRTNEKGALK